jgi:hypothetical protein
VSVQLDCTSAPQVVATIGATEVARKGYTSRTEHTDREGDLWMAASSSGDLEDSRSLLFAWDVPPDREEPWRRFLQELSDSRYEEYTQSRRRLGVLTESVWLAPKPSGGGVAIVYLEAEDPEQALRELAGSDAPFERWYGRHMRRLFGFDLSRLSRVADSELLFAWGEAPSDGRQITLPHGSSEENWQGTVGDDPAFGNEEGGNESR